MILVNLCNKSQRKKGQSWYARLSDDKKAVYLEKLRISRQQKKAAALSPNVASLGGSSPLLSTGMAKNNLYVYCVSRLQIMK
jgi:hypothetical protein